MPRDPGTGVYTLPLPPTEPRRIPVTGWANVTVEDLAASMNNIPGGALAPGSVGTTQLADNSVSTAELVDNSVTNAKMADNSVNTAELVDGAVTGPKLDLSTTGLVVGSAIGGNASIELGRQNGVASTPFIDFHSGATAVDFDSRIIASGGTGVSGGGALTLIGAPVSLSLGQLQFPATQNPSADSNTLDDYEEGTFTPSITFTTPGNQSIAYSNRSGSYTKIGDVVNFRVQLATSTFTHTTSSGSIDITGLPFAVGATSAASVGYNNGFMRPSGGAGFASIYAQATSSLVRLYAVGSPTDGSTITGSFAGHTSGVTVEISVSGSYKVA